MPRNAGYVEQATTPQLGTSYVGVLLQKNAADIASVDLPTSGYELSHLEIIMATDATPATVEAYLSWDSAGDDIAAGPTQTAVKLAALQTATRKGCVIFLDRIRPRTPAVDQTTAGTIYLWLKVDATTGTGTEPDLVRARLHFRSVIKVG